MPQKTTEPGTKPYFSGLFFRPPHLAAQDFHFQAHFTKTAFCNRGDHLSSKNSKITHPPAKKKTQIPATTLYAENNRQPLKPLFL